jgi:hypothetical protein
LPEITVVATPIPPTEPPTTEAVTDETPSACDFAEQTLFDEPIDPPPLPPPPTLRLDSNGFRIEVIGTVRYNHAGLKVEYTTPAEQAAKEKEFFDTPF